MFQIGVNWSSVAHDSFEVLVKRSKGRAELTVLYLISIVLIKALDKQFKLLFFYLDLEVVGNEVINVLDADYSLALDVKQTESVDRVVFGAQFDHLLLVLF